MTNIKADPHFAEAKEDLDEMESSWRYTQKIQEGSAIARAGHNLKASTRELLANWPTAVVRDAMLTETKKHRDLNTEVVEVVIDHAINRPRESFIATYPLDRFLALARQETGK